MSRNDRRGGCDNRDRWLSVDGKGILLDIERDRARDIEIDRPPDNGTGEIDDEPVEGARADGRAALDADALDDIERNKHRSSRDGIETDADDERFAGKRAGIPGDI